MTEKWTEIGYLSEEGKKLFGHIFKDGKIPLRHILPCNVEVKGYKGIAYMFDFEKISFEQQTQIRNFMINVRGVPIEQFEYLLKECNGCIPIRESLVSGGSSSTLYRHLL